MCLHLEKFIVRNATCLKTNTTIKPTFSVFLDKTSCKWFIICKKRDGDNLYIFYRHCEQPTNVLLVQGIPPMLVKGISSPIRHWSNENKTLHQMIFCFEFSLPSILSTELYFLWSWSGIVILRNRSLHKNASKLNIKFVPIKWLASLTLQLK